MASSGQSQPQQQEPYLPYRPCKTLSVHSRAVSCVKFSPDGELLATASLDETLAIICARTLTLKSRLIGHTEGVSDFAWSSCSRYICSASDDKLVRIWEVETAKSIKTFRGHSDYVFCVDFSPDTKRVVSGSFDETVRVWDVKNSGIERVIQAHSMPVTSVNFNRDGSLIVSSSHDGTCKIWDAEKGTCLKVLIDDRGGPAVSFAKFSPNGKFILVATLDDTLKLWNHLTGKSLKIYQGHVNNVYCITSTFSVTNGRYVVGGSEDRCVYLWDLKGKNMVQRLDGHSDTVISVTCHPQKNMIASASLDKDKTVRIWVQDV